ncbi:MAG TPA: hypothetical protein VIG47_07440 [Gemmatimonadaceae bacterium]
MYTGNDAHGIPRYAHIALNGADRKLLRDVYGIEDPNRLYVSDSTDGHLLKYDTRFKRCARCYVNSYRVGFVSIRRPEESWNQLEQRVKHMRRRDFPAEALVPTTSITALDPDVVQAVQKMLSDARTVGFRLHVRETYRSPQREAYLMSAGGSRTHTLTSLHSYGRAIDVAIDDGNPSHARTRKHWVAFRRWVTTYGEHQFSVVGTTDSTWDWPHVKIPNASVGFASIDAAIARARVCTSAGHPSYSCDFLPHVTSIGTTRR